MPLTIKSDCKKKKIIENNKFLYNVFFHYSLFPYYLIHTITLFVSFLSLALITICYKFAIPIIGIHFYYQNCLVMNLLILLLISLVIYQICKLIIQTALRGNVLPIVIGASGPDIILCPILAPRGYKIYLFSPS